MNLFQYGLKDDYVPFVTVAGDLCQGCDHWTQAVWREINPGVVNVLCPTCYEELPTRFEAEDIGAEWDNIWPVGIGFGEDEEQG